MSPIVGRKNFSDRSVIGPGWWEGLIRLNNNGQKRLTRQLVGIPKSRMIALMALINSFLGKADVPKKSGASRYAHSEKKTCRKFRGTLASSQSEAFLIKTKLRPESRSGRHLRGSSLHKNSAANSQQLEKLQKVTQFSPKRISINIRQAGQQNQFRMGAHLRKLAPCYHVYFRGQRR